MEKLTLAQAVIALAAGQTIIKIFSDVSLKVYYKIENGVLLKSYDNFDASYLCETAKDLTLHGNEISLVKHEEELEDDQALVDLTEETLRPIDSERQNKIFNGLCHGLELDDHFFPVTK